MPIEIRELHIKVTVSTDAARAAAEQPAKGADAAYPADEEPAILASRGDAASGTGHPGGVNMVFADGSVRFANDGFDLFG